MSLILPSAQLVTELTEIGFQRVVGIKDREVLCPTVDWLHRFCEWMQLNHHHAYEPGKYDCEDFAWDAVSDATRSLLQNGKVANVGHAFMLCTIGISFLAELNGLPGNVDTHSCNICRTEDGWYLAEPQNGQRTAVAGLADGVVLLWDLVLV